MAHGSARQPQSPPTAEATEFEFITNPDHLQTAVARLMTESPAAVGIDTEFIPESRYVPQLCLVQLATPTGVIIVDPLEVPDLTPLAPLFGANGPRIIVHAGIQDVGLMALATGVRPENVFDTQIAAALLTKYEQASFADLCRKFLHQAIDKRSTITRWNRRPLNAQQLQYAADDVKYLLPLFEATRKQLLRRNRESWAEEECRRLYEERTLRWADDEGGYRKLPKAASLSGEQLAVLRELFNWREERAKAENANPQSIIADHKLVRIAGALPKTLDDLQGLRQMPAGLLKHHADAILAGIATGLATPDHLRPEPVRPPTHRHLSAEDSVHVDALILLTKIVAQREEIAASVLAKRDRLVACVRDGFEDALAEDGPLSGWRGELLGPILRRWAAGELRFGLDLTVAGGGSLAFFDAEGVPKESAYVRPVRPSGPGKPRKRRRRRKSTTATNSATATASDDDSPTPTDSGD